MMWVMAASNSVDISLTRATVITLVELLGRWEWAGELEVLPVQHPAETAALVRLMLVLRESVPEIFGEGYADEVRAAYAEVDGSGPA